VAPIGWRHRISSRCIRQRRRPSFRTAIQFSPNLARSLSTSAIATLEADLDADELAVKRLKKRKLQLKDCIAKLESALIPDEPA